MLTHTHRAYPPNKPAVPAAEVLAIVEEVGQNYRIVQRKESKKERRERFRAQPEEREEAAEEEGGGEADEEDEAEELLMHCMSDMRYVLLKSESW